MSRTRNRERIPMTVHFQKENKKYIEKIAEKEDRPFSQMVDILISRIRQHEKAVS